MNPHIKLIPLFFVLLISFSIVLQSFPIVKAVPDTLYLDEPTVTNAYTQGGWDGAGLGYSFAGNDEYLSVAMWYVKDADSTPNSGNWSCVLYAGSGNTILQWSYTLINTTTVDDSQFFTISFGFTHTVKLFSGQTYIIGLMNNGSVSGAYMVGHPDAGAYYTKANWGSSWSYQAGSGLFAHKLYTNSVAVWDEPTPPPPTPTPIPTDPVSSTLPIIVGLIVPVFIPLIIIMAVAFISWKFAGSWGFFAGLNIGIILCFVFTLLSMWVVVVMVIVDALLLFGKIGFDRYG